MTIYYKFHENLQINKKHDSVQQKIDDLVKKFLKYVSYQ